MPNYWDDDSEQRQPMDRRTRDLIGRMSARMDKLEEAFGVSDSASVKQASLHGDEMSELKGEVGKILSTYLPKMSPAERTKATNRIAQEAQKNATDGVSLFAAAQDVLVSSDMEIARQLRVAQTISNFKAESAEDKKALLEALAQEQGIELPIVDGGDVPASSEEDVSGEDKKEEPETTPPVKQLQKASSTPVTPPPANTSELDKITQELDNMNKTFF